MKKQSSQDVINKLAILNDKLKKIREQMIALENNISEKNHISYH